MRAFGFKNVADTCLWCGDALRVERDVVRETTGEWNPPTECHSCRGEGREFTALSAQEAFDAGHGNVPELGWFRCCDCDVVSHGQKRERIVSREPLRKNDRGGYAGHGRFCTLRCGYQWAMVLANSGLRIEKRGDKLVWLKP